MYRLLNTLIIRNQVREFLSHENLVEFGFGVCFNFLVLEDLKL